MIWRAALCIFVAPTAGCMTSIKEAPKHLTRLCVIRPADKMCWYDKISNDGISIDKLDGYFAENSDDLDEMIFGLNQCKPK